MKTGFLGLSVGLFVFFVLSTVSASTGKVCTEVSSTSGSYFLHFKVKDSEEVRKIRLIPLNADAAASLERAGYLSRSEDAGRVRVCVEGTLAGDLFYAYGASDGVLTSGRF